MVKGAAGKMFINWYYYLEPVFERSKYSDRYFHQVNQRANRILLEALVDRIEQVLHEFKELSLQDAHQVL